jgi:DNA-3-methyladenine glycosylase
MDITKTQNKMDLTTPPLYVKDALPVPQNEIVETTRIGVAYAEEWKSRPWRFYIRGNKYASTK